MVTPLANRFPAHP